ncbi:glycosyltransferase [Thermogladius sp. KZ2Tp1]|uniref:glycosyltransferase family 2 protein n=1 Tax=Thermogladius sp. KZ2Tp1 TaxID=3136289 RepID=UPI003DA90D89
MPRWLEARGVDGVIVVAEASNEDTLVKYERVLSKYDDKVTYVLNKGRLGSVNARNKLLELAFRNNCRYGLMVDDDYLLPGRDVVRMMKAYLDRYPDVGAVGGRVIPLRKRAVDPDFFLNTPIPIADAVTKITGYIFLDVRNGPRYAEYLTHFFMIRGELLDRVRYSRVFETPTAFREESDLQMQIRKLGYKLILVPRAYVYHLALEEGGDRPKMSMRERMYWKSRNHTKFIAKWVKSPMIKTWYMLNTAVILTLYRPHYIKTVLKGIRDGLT